MIMLYNISCFVSSVNKHGKILDKQGHISLKMAVLFDIVIYAIHAYIVNKHAHFAVLPGVFKLFQ